MANKVFANGREISCKAAAGKSIAAFPDVCFTPPLTPATPPGVPIPYPNTGMSSDATDGSKNVKISGKEIMLKNKSYFKTSTGDEAGSAPKKGVVTSKIKGKVYFKSWSMDVKFEGENVVRHMDMTTHNHASEPPQTPPWMHVDKMAKAVRAQCKDEIDRAEAACKGKTPSNCGAECRKAQKCLLVPKGKDKEACCAPHTTGHHMIEDHWVQGNSAFPKAQGSAGYDAAPTVCANRFRKRGTVHRRLHDIQGVIEESFMKGGARYDSKLSNGGWNYKAGKDAALAAHQEVFKDSNCSPKCMEAQLDAFYGKGPNRSLNKPETQALGKSRERLKAKYGGSAAGDF
jgi:hypothetical protein